MEVTYTLCAWCERTAEEVRQEDGINGPEEALVEAVVNNERIRLCRRCLKRFAPNAVAGREQVQIAVVDFPPGIRSVDHVCPALIEQGTPEEDAELELLMHREGDYYVGQCPYWAARGARLTALLAETLASAKDC